MTSPSAPQKINPRREWLSIQGLDCPDEAAIVRDAILPLPGVQDIIFDYTTSSACVLCDVRTPSATDLAATITQAGLKSRPTTGQAPAAAPVRDTMTGWLAGIGAVLISLGFICDVIITGGLYQAVSSHDISWPALVSYMAAIVVTGIKLVPRAWAGIRAFRADMYVLMIIAVIGAALLGEWLEGATVCVLFLVSLSLEQWSAGRARHAIAALLDIAPTTARVRHGEEEQEVAVDQVPIGSTLIVQPGERIPLDGTVSQGTSHVDQASLTGESIPVVKNMHDTVFAGTVNGEGLLQVVTTGGAADTTLSRMMRLVADARSKRGKTERWADNFARIYTPIVVIIAVLIAVVPPLLFAQEWSTWSYRALVLLVIACPCALVIATPVATVSALARAARVGVLVKGGEFLEIAAAIRCVVFDKTGTLTIGQPVVAAILPAPASNEETVVRVAMALDRRSDHPLAKAIVQAGEKRGFNENAVDDINVLPGLGVSGVRQQQNVWIGSSRLANQFAPDDTWRPTWPKDQPGSQVLIGADGRVLGGIVLSDQERPETRDALIATKNLGIQHMAMLTGDADAVARVIAQRIGITDVHSELLPADKVDRINNIRQQYGSIAFVGDGVNDAPALARADLGIAMGAAATPAALETADVALLSNDLRRLPWLISHARRTHHIVLQNIIAALGTKVIFLVLTLFGFSSLWIAIAADTGVSVLVTLNALRLLRAHNSNA